jgi:DNA-binding response OmpR family regulator
MSRKILVVDDEEDLRHIMHAFFEGFGFQVATAASAEEALAILGRDSYPVMFLDLNLPGMNGLELCRRLRSNHPRSSIFALTGYHKLFTTDAAEEVGFDDYFTKPVDLHLLHNVALAAFERIEAGPVIPS